MAALGRARLRRRGGRWRLMLLRRRVLRPQRAVEHLAERGARHLLHLPELLLDRGDALLHMRDVCHIDHNASLAFPFLI